ncbi:hypothetical protein Tco_0689097, partial [Tanacetum coccineum]
WDSGSNVGEFDGHSRRVLVRSMQSPLLMKTLL